MAAYLLAATCLLDAVSVSASAPTMPAQSAYQPDHWPLSWECPLACDDEASEMSSSTCLLVAILSVFTSLLVAAKGVSTCLW